MTIEATQDTEVQGEQFDCSCTAVQRVIADNDPASGSLTKRLIRMTEGVCNACGRRRP